MTHCQGMQSSASQGSTAFSSLACLLSLLAANFDYVPRNGDRVTIPQGSQSACWPIVINGDEIRESDETFQVEIALEDSDDTLSASIFTVTILDDGDCKCSSLIYTRAVFEVNCLGLQCWLSACRWILHRMVTLWCSRAMQTA